MSKPLVLVTAPTVSGQTQQLLRDAGIDIAYMDNPVTEAALLSALERRETHAILLRGPAPLTSTVLAAAKYLRIISKYGAGIDSVDMASATARGIAVMVAGGANASAVAEHALALMLCLSREVPRFDRELRRGIWKNQAYVVRDFSCRTVGIVGYGQIGRRTAQLAHACGASLVIYSRSRATVPPGMEWESDLDRLLHRVDILSLHCPLTPQTQGMIGEMQLRQMKPDALIINTARGKLIDEDALIAALSTGRLAGAGLDTFAMEPPDPRNPLFALPNVICTPHIAAATTDAAVRMSAIASNSIISYLRGEIYDAANFLNPEVFNGAKRG
jgi:D-3-phosphoglycerate dehydrogenase